VSRAMDTRTRRAFAAWIGAIGIAVASGILLFWWKHRNGGPGDIGAALISMIIAAMQLLPGAGLVAILWSSSKALRVVLTVLAILLGAASSLFGVIPIVVGLIVMAIAARLLLSGRRSVFAAWVALSAICLALGVAALIFLWSLG
jgi:hypothetical protein